MRAFLLCAIALVVTLSALTGCGAHAPEVAVMKYEDFGPQSAVYEWLGYSWWQWQDEGGGDPNAQYDIRVVVYRNVTESVVRRRYPVDPKTLHDYRYISYDDALRHLDELIAEDVIPTLTEKLRSTRDELRSRFGDALARPPR